MSNLIGRVVEMPSPCQRCGGTDAALGHGQGPHAASLLCACGAHLGWLPKAAFKFIHETTVQFGAHMYEPIILRGALDHAEEVKAMTKTWDNTNRGALFRDDSKAKPEDRDYSGTIDVGGMEYWLSAWIKTSKKGAKFLSLSVKPKIEPAPEKKPDLNDEVAF